MDMVLDPHELFALSPQGKDDRKGDPVPVRPSDVKGKGGPEEPVTGVEEGSKRQNATERLFGLAVFNM